MKKVSSKTNPFDFIKIINKKESEISLSEIDENGYNPYLTNRNFSFFSDTLFFANEINKYSGQLSKKQQFDFYYHLLPKKNRYSKWLKKENLDQNEIELIVEYEQCSIREAKQMLMIIKNETKQKQQQIFEKMKREVYKGGKK